MADLKAQLEISADASGVEVGVSKAKRSLADLGSSASSAGKQASDGLATMGRGGEQSAVKIDAATKNMIGSIQRTIATMEAGSRSSAKYFETLASQRGIDVSALKPYLDQLDAVAAKQKVAEQSLRATDPAMKQAGVSAAQTAFAMRQLPAQINDIVVSLQGGQRPLTVFMQQGGQIKDMFGGIGPAARAMAGYIGGLVNPFTVAAAAAGALAIAYYKGTQEADAYSKALILTGNYAGKTAGQLTDMARRIDGIVGTQAAAAEALAQFAQSGQISGDSLERFTEIALKMERETGQAVSETVKQFAELGKSPVEASLKLNEATHFLTISLYQQIKALEDQGKTSEAAALAQKAYADEMDSRMRALGNQLGTIEKAWRGLKDIAKEAWDAMLDIGREKSGSQKLDDISRAIKLTEENIAKLEKLPGRGKTIEATKEQLAALKEQQAFLQENIRLETRSATIGKENADRMAARARFDKDGDKFLSEKLKMEKEITKAIEDGKAAGASQKEISDRVAAIRASHKSLVSEGRQVDKAQLGLDIETIQAANLKLVGSYKNAEQIMESVRAAGLMSDREYYESKRAFVRLESSAQEDALQKEIARYEQAKFTGKDKLENDKKIAEAQAKLATLRADTTSKLVVLTNQEEAATKRLQLSYLTARQAAQDYFDVIQRQQARELAGMGKGEERRRFDTGVNQIEDRYAAQRRDLENQKAQLEMEGKFTEDARAQYEQRLSIINEFQARSISSYKAYYDELRKKQGDWALGAEEGLNNYLDNAQNVFRQSESLVTNAFQGMEDALVNFVTTGKLSFGDLAKSILADLARMQAKAAISSIFGKDTGGAGGLGSLFSLLGGSKNPGTFATEDIFSSSAWESMIASAKGNIFDAGSVVKFATGAAFTNSVVSKPTTFPLGVMGEAGPEAIMPLMRGPDGSLGVQSHGSQPVRMNYAPVFNIDSRADRAQIMADVDRISRSNVMQAMDQLNRQRRI